MSDLRIRAMRSDEIAIAADWAAAEGWNPGLADAACFATVVCTENLYPDVVVMKSAKDRV